MRDKERCSARIDGVDEQLIFYFKCAKNDYHIRNAVSSASYTETPFIYWMYSRKIYVQKKPWLENYTVAWQKKDGDWWPYSSMVDTPQPHIHWCILLLHQDYNGKF